ncbi:MAG TPA: Fic family protein [archaeon]|nr:Fic family protein [archaeon]HPV66512.1 Fic family protein [archaeon]
MVSVIKKKKGTKKAYYLHMTLRSKKGYKNLDKYIGMELPTDLRTQKLDFFISSQQEQLEKISEQISKQNTQKSKIPKTVQENQMFDFAVKFTYNTSRIEGNTLSLKDSYLLLKDQISPQKPMRDIKEIESHQKLFLELIKKSQKISYQNLINWHYYLFKDTKKDIAGKIRNYQVGISGCKFLPPSPAELSAEISDFFKWYDKNKSKYNPVILAGLVHLRLVTIHPFGDGNGRITRLLMNIILNNNNCPLFIIDYKNKKSYYSALERSQVKEDDSYFLSWFLKSYLVFIKHK